MNMRMLVLQ